MNVGTLWRSAYIFGAAYIFTLGHRYKKQSSDTTKSWRHIPLFNYPTWEQFIQPHDCLLVGIEIVEEAQPIEKYKHPERAIYLLGAEDHGLTNEALNRCNQIIQLPGKECFNVAVAGSLVMYDRWLKGEV